ncbi:MAG TPA: carboxylating nicotinate-nucleotide diphosphorylase [Thermoplasmata archaeon]
MPAAPSARAASLGPIRAALAEDRVDLDRTTIALFPRPVRATAHVIAQAAGTVSGVRVATAIARGAGLRARASRRDGDRVVAGTTVLTVRGDLRRILGVERTMLNFLMHLSGVATATARAVRAAGPLQVFATRKTLPGLRDLEKSAVVHGGGHPHRRDLSDLVLIKNNHLAHIAVVDAVGKARRSVGGRRPVQVEVRTAADARSAARAGADALLLDNQGPAQARRIVRSLESAGLRRRVWVEVSGGVTPETVRRYRRSGADAASLGALTHSAAALPFHLVVDRPRAARRPRHST